MQNFASVGGRLIVGIFFGSFHFKMVIPAKRETLQKLDRKLYLELFNLIAEKEIAPGVCQTSDKVPAWRE